MGRTITEKVVLQASHIFLHFSWKNTAGSQDRRMLGEDGQNHGRGLIHITLDILVYQYNSVISGVH